MKNIFKAFTTLMVAIMAIGCSPMTKESYMADYEAFVDEVLAEYKSYTTEVWTDKEEQFELYRTEYYNRFKGEMTTEERAKVLYYEVLFSGCRAYDKSADFINGVRQAYNIDQKLEEGIESAKDYVENELEDDARELGKKAKQGAEEFEQKADKAVKDLTEKSEKLLKDLESTIDEL